ncbi:hypothetical protein SAMN05216464_11619 [Mucilaginibacter pineti]|uniref:TonB-dependent outer membrane receptor, SusC/RagA subfamily, signature region n=1 Tax=Mucilaginibacter pineti TaxID=1391627 RepID=A0A1G7K744_9SPHI|nr:TonB-dependent receptor [Mucilaginibacter pineti]SDF32982.1 hypothetical protein SAMN05216464_11619 [Mucilaginibacter pineti]
MKYKKISAGLLLMTVVAGMLSFTGPGDDLLTKLVDQLYKWRAEQPIEKVYLHLDKSSYAIGDDIWFKAYVTIGNKHQLSAYSEILNVDLIDGNDSVKRSIKLPLISGLAYGDFALADSLEEGNYRIRAYTNWMRNAGEAYFFDKTITVAKGINNVVFTNTAYTFINQKDKQKINAAITYTTASGVAYAGNEVTYDVELNGKIVSKGRGTTDANGNFNVGFTTSAGLAATGHIVTNIKLENNKTFSKVIPIKALSNNVDVQFFPESGNLLNGAESKIAFKAVNADGLGADVKGTIVNDQNQEITTFSSTHLGMGVFALKPEASKSYKAKITYADGSTGEFALPKATDNGYVLSVDDSFDDDIAVKVIPGAAISGSTTPTGGLTLVAQSAGEIYYAANSADGGKTFTNVIPKSKFPSGIVQLTLFSAAGEPLNERLIFIRNPVNDLKLSVNADKKTSAPRQKVTISLNAKDSDAKPAIGSFSASVIDLSKVLVDEGNEESIFSNVLLTSDLKGYIEKPGYYFNNINAKTNADLDVLLLTQGYRRFEWKKLLANAFEPIVYQPEKTLEVSGYIKTFGGKPVPNAKITLLTTSGGFFMLDTASDDKGRFVFKNLVFRDSMKFVIQARTAKDRKNVDITLDNIAPQASGKNKNAADVEVNISDVKSKYLQNSKQRFNEDVKYGIGNHTIVLKEVVIKDKKQVLTHSSNLNGPGNADQVITYKDLEMGSGNLALALQIRVSGVIFRNGVPYSNRSPNKPMTIMLDGIEMEKDYLNSMGTFDVASVEVLRTIGNTAMYGFRGDGGVLVITTKRGGEGSVYNRYAPGIVTYAPKGYYKAREFYSPQYDDPKTNTQMLDLRSTVSWHPNIVTDKDGNASFSFFNTDGKGTYRILIEGIDAEGDLGHQVYTYKVE